MTQPHEKHMLLVIFGAGASRLIGHWHRDRRNGEFPSGIALESDLPAVTDVLIIGWRAAEPPAVAVLDGYQDPMQGLMPSYNLGIVTLEQTGWDELLGNLGQAARKGVPRVWELGGFSEFIKRVDTHLADLLVPRGS
jgi:hypothetical protein